MKNIVKQYESRAYMRKKSQQKTRRTYNISLLRMLYVVIYLALAPFISAQPYIEGGKTRHRFAQLTLGLDYRYFHESKNDLPEPILIQKLHQARMIVGGTHFWGHADFFLSIPLVNLSSSALNPGLETGFRYYPWQIENKKLRPFIGLGFQSLELQIGEGTRKEITRIPLTLGIGYNRGPLLMDFSLGFFPNTQTDYYVDKQRNERILLPQSFISFSLKYMLETTLSAEKSWQSGRTQFLTDTLAKLKKLNAWTLAIGASSGIFLHDNDYNASENPYLGSHRYTQVFPDFGLGYYIHSADLQFNISYRGMRSKLEAYGDEQRFSRKSVGLEVFKFLGDYHGFAPFAGPILSMESLAINQNLQGSATHHTRDFISAGIVFGWDIRPNRLQSWYLRTNLRWYPTLNVTSNQGKKYNFQMLEFNFIQLVIFPDRLFGF